MQILRFLRPGEPGSVHTRELRLPNVERVRRRAGARLDGKISFFRKFPANVRRSIRARVSAGTQSTFTRIRPFRLSHALRYRELFDGKRWEKMGEVVRGKRVT